MMCRIVKGLFGLDMRFVLGLMLDVWLENYLGMI